MKKIIRNIKRLIFVFIIMIIFSIYNIFTLINKAFYKDNINYNPIINVNKEEIYLALNEQFILETNIEDIEYEILNKEIITINNNIITGIKSGNTIIKLKKYNTVKEIKVNVSDLYTLPIINNNKNYLSCNQYTESENNYLDKVLEYKINNAGYKTRAGVVEASRFLTLSFKYRIHYFYENGRLLTNGTRSYVDGEGRYYHKGLYLSESKYDTLYAKQYGPSIWGCPLYTKIQNITTPNGLDCSGFISWALLNAGFDVGDRGAGISEIKTNDLDDLGEKIEINYDTLNNNLYKVGDLISRDGHIGILIGIGNDRFYVAESLDYDLHVNIYNTEELINSDWTYFINMDNLYLSDGNLTNMW
ncbi:MAG: hypothetical protein IJD92_02320 [Bacilli bacterium]|nr:hypothetical protein [Bacilli bacterium]